MNTKTLQAALEAQPAYLQCRENQPPLKTWSFVEIQAALAELSKEPLQHWLPIELAGANASFQRAAREYAEEYAEAAIRLALGAGESDVLDVRRYRRLQILGCAPMGSDQLAKGLVLRFQSLDAFVDGDIEGYPSRGESIQHAPQPSGDVNALSADDVSLIRLALHRLSSQGRQMANEAGQDKAGNYFKAGSVTAFLHDAKHADRLIKFFDQHAESKAQPPVSGLTQEAGKLRSIFAEKLPMLGCECGDNRVPLSNGTCGRCGRSGYGSSVFRA